MSKNINLEVHKRDLVTKGGLKSMRKENKIPGVYYSHDSKESIPFYIMKSEINKAIKATSQIFNIKVGSKERNVLFKSVQYHPISEEIMHIDLYGIKMDQKVAVNISINFIGTPKGVTVDGGILVQGMNEIEIECLPGDIPETLEVNIEELGINESLRVGDLKLDEKLSVKTDEDQVLASITQAMKEEELEASTEGAEIEDEDSGATDASQESGDSASDAKDEESKNESED